MTRLKLWLVLVTLLASACTFPSIVNESNTALVVEQRCSDGGYLPLSDLGLNASSRLLVAENDLWMLLGGANQTTSILNQQADFMGASPNRQWFLFRTFDEHGAPIDLWLSSSDGKTQRKLDLPNNGYGWIDNDHIAGFEFDHPSVFFAAWINLSTMTSIKLQPLWSHRAIFSFSPTSPELIYSDFVSWRLYNYSTNTDKPIMPWLDVSQSAVSLPSIHWSQQGVSVATLNESTIDLTLNLLPSELGRTSVISRTIGFPGQSLSSATRVDWWSNDNEFVLVSQNLGNDPYGGRPWKSYLLNTVEWKLYDYCLPDLKGINGLSSDKQLFAWSTAIDGQDGVLIVEVASGKRAWLPGVAFLSWLEVK